MTKRMLSAEKIKQEKVFSARGRLAGALTHAKNTKVDDEDEDSQEPIVKPVAPTQPTRGRPKLSKNSTSSKSQKGAGNQQIQSQQQSYIMKLFDRSVNLAKFDEETSLYPICRAWMKNSPRHKTEESPKKTNIKKGDDEVHEMPRIVFDDQETDGEDEDMDKPEVVPRCPPPDISEPQKELLDGIDYNKPKETKASLLKMHKARWTGIREKWNTQSKKFEERYFAANIELIESLKYPPAIK